MRASDGKGRCQEAAQYYYDFLQPDKAAVPPQVREHVANCPFCREQVRCLAKGLPPVRPDAGSPNARTDEATVETLAGHLELIEEQVTCSRVRFSLPGLLRSSPQLRIPTPVTVHLDHCPRCADDLAAIRAMELRVDQLDRLSRVFGESSGCHLAECREAQPAVAVLGSFSLEEVDTRILNHISTCPQCRISVYRHRERHLAADPGVAPCCRVATADLFDLVVPYGMERAGESRSRGILGHVRGCPACREKIQMLHRTLYGIAERADSGISTVYTTRDPVERAGEPVGTIPPRYPVHVQVLQGGPEPAPGGDGPSAVRVSGKSRRSLRANRTSFARIAFATVVAFLLVSLVFTSTPTVSGTSVGEILQALRREPNIHVVSSRTPDEAPFEELWVARDLNVLVMKTSRNCVLFDFAERCKKTIDRDRGIYVAARLTDREYEGARAIAADCGGAVLAGISPGTRLQETADESLGEAEPKVAVYELNRARPVYHPDSPSSYRYRISVDRAGRLPQRIEHLRREPSRTEWKTIRFQVFEYPAEGDMKDAIRAMFPE